MKNEAEERRRVRVRAPVRVDFAGGTLDIPPLFFLHYPAFTVNVAIELYATVTLRPLPGRKVRLIFLRGRKRPSISWDSPGEIRVPRQRTFALPARLVRSMEIEGGVEITMKCEAPIGSGLGGSSALAIALAQALLKWKGQSWSTYHLIEHVKSVETQSIRVPTGYQDYYSAVYGGASLLTYTWSGVKRQPACPPSFLSTLEKHLLLVYSGKSRFSGANNWELFKRRIDHDPKTIAFFDALRENSERMQEAFASQNIYRIARAMNEDWRIRKEMIPEMTTPKIEALIETARQYGARAARVCGAGGGGCIAFLVPPEAKILVAAGLYGTRVKYLCSTIARQGAQVLTEE